VNFRLLREPFSTLFIGCVAVLLHDSSYEAFFLYDTGAWSNIPLHGVHAFSLAAAVCV
jgi:hypothetical protein